MYSCRGWQYAVKNQLNGTLFRFLKETPIEGGRYTGTEVASTATRARKRDQRHRRTRVRSQGSSERKSPGEKQKGSQVSFPSAHRQGVGENDFESIGAWNTWDPLGENGEGKRTAASKNMETTIKGLWRRCGVTTTKGRS